MADLAQLTAWRDALMAARYQGIRTVEYDGKRVTYATDAEMAAALEALVQQGGGHASIYHSREGLPRFCQVIANAALFVAGSTGPLHIAGALDVPTVGFFPARRSATPLRWQPLNSEGRHLAFSPPEDSDHPEDMSQLDPKTMAAAIARWAPPFWRTES